MVATLLFGKTNTKYALGNEKTSSMPMPKSIQTFQNHLVELYGSEWDLHGILLMFTFYGNVKDTYKAFKPQTATYGSEFMVLDSMAY